MRIVTTPAAAREALASMPKPVGLVPTMGFLHEGHLSLVRRCRGENATAVVSIFVNPLQFGPREDLSSYPRNLVRDQDLLERLETDLVFAPDASAMYPSDASTFVEETRLSADLCGAARPGHFRGVCTVVLKLFHIVQPQRAYFGEKDFQQLQVIRRMVRDLDVPVEVVGCPLVREADGLALSSRNVYLSPEDRLRARALSRSLAHARDLVARGVGVLLLGDGEEERRRGEALARDLPFVKNAVSAYSLRQTLAAVGGLDAVVGGDSGVLHMALALGVPTVGLFGPTLPAQVSLGGVDCPLLADCPQRGCQRWECPEPCLESIGTAAVLGALEELGVA